MSARTVAWTRCACLVLAATAIAPTASANERQFTYTYESLVLNPGDVELEPWMSVEAKLATQESILVERYLIILSESASRSSAR